LKTDGKRVIKRYEVCGLRYEVRSEKLNERHRAQGTGCKDKDRRKIKGERK
jgi:hypothetical protein